MDRAQHFAGPGLATADDCDDGEEVSRVRLRYPKHLMSCTIALAHTLTPSHTVRCLDRDTAGDCIGRAVQMMMFMMFITAVALMSLMFLSFIFCANYSTNRKWYGGEEPEGFVDTLHVCGRSKVINKPLAISDTQSCPEAPD